MAPSATSERGILLVDDGELDEVARMLDDQGVAYERLRGGQIPDEVPPPRDLLIVTPRRVERVRRGSPADARPGRPLRIIATLEDSPAMRRRLRRAGLHLLIRLPADPEIWRLLVARALYRGSERRVDERVAVGALVELGNEAGNAAAATQLLDLSNRGCRLQTSEPLAVGDPVAFTIPANSTIGCEMPALALSGKVRRRVDGPEPDTCRVAVVFDAKMPETTRTHLTSLINHWASGPGQQTKPQGSMSETPAIPPCRLPSIPDLMLDDETDPPISAENAVAVSLESAASERKVDRRQQARGHFASPIMAETDNGPFVLIGRDLSSGGMRIERHPDLAVGDRFRVALRGPSTTEALEIDAEIVRDDGDKGFGVSFARIGRERARELEKWVACLPEVESLEEGEAAGLGAILSEILNH